MEEGKRVLATICQLAISGVTSGFIYALVAIEYTLIFNACSLLNFAHAKTITLCAYIFAGTFLKIMNGAALPAIALSLIAIVLIGVIIAFMIFIPLQKYTRLIAIMATVMLGTVMTEAAVRIWGPVPLSSGKFLAGTVKLGAVTTSRANICIMIVALIVSVLLKLFIAKTKTGQAMTCVAQDKTAAALMGINVNRNMAFSIGLSFAICGIIGIMVVPLYTAQQAMADMIGMKGFAAGVIGGFGDINGAIIGGIVLGLIENFACLAVPAMYKDIIAFMMMIVFLLIKPDGLTAKK